MKFAVLGLLVVLLIGFFVVVWKAARDWRWYNIVAVCITMLLAVLFLFPTAGVLESRRAWHQVKERLEKEAVEAEVDNRLIKYGDPDNPELGQGVVDLDQQLSKLGVEAGRRWRNLQFQGVANNLITLVEPQGGAPKSKGFLGRLMTVPQPPRPPNHCHWFPRAWWFTGSRNCRTTNRSYCPPSTSASFVSTASTPNSVTLTPTGPLEPSQMQAIGNQQARSWSLYELLPLDGHHTFVAEGSEPTDDSYFGRMDDDLIAKLFGNRVSPETLKAYQEDGRRATDDDPPLSRWWKIEFTKNHAIDVDSPEQRGALDGGFFDGNGRAVDGRLQRGENGQVQFKKGDQILVKEEAANQLIDEGVAELRDRFFLRPLNDYRYILRRVRLRLTELANRKTELEFETKVLQEAIAKTEGMLVSNQAIKLKLEQDVAQFRVEKNAITSYTEQLRQQVDTMRADMARLHQQNLVLEQQIEQKQLDIERRLDALTSVR